MAKLADKYCTPCRKSAVPLKGDALKSLQEELDPDWVVVDEHHLSKTYRFANFVKPLEVLNQIAKLAEEEGHHPDLYLAWGILRVDVWSHTIDGLTESDFILCAKIDRMLKA